MNLTLDAMREERMTRMIGDAGSVWTWYKHVTAQGGTAYLGIGPSDIFATARITGIWAQAGQNELGLAGGLIPAGQEVLYCVERVGTADRLSWSGANFEVVAEPQPALLFQTMYWKTVLKRG